VEQGFWQKMADHGRIDSRYSLTPPLNEWLLLCWISIICPKPHLI
jgi:hypothetical protein